MKIKNKKQLAGTLMLIIAFLLAWYWFNYKLMLILFLALLGNNLEQEKK